ncbi:MAG: response regulator transcription factor, partial [Anaerolineae bacterium]|nr:response regulator transcription factor [Anaerolineae bacterium]
VEAIYKAVEGEPTLAPEATKALIRASLRPTIPDYNLTERELEVLSLMARGLNNPQIADHLMISRSTVKFHVSTILSKLGVATRTEAAIFAKEHNLVKM